MSDNSILPPPPCVSNAINGRTPPKVSYILLSTILSVNSEIADESSLAEPNFFGTVNYLK